MSEWFEGAGETPAHIPTATVPETSFWQNAEQAYAIMRAEDLPIISRTHMSETRESRISTLLGHAKSGAIPENVMDFYWSQPGGLDVDALSQYARNDLGLLDIPTPGDYEVARKAEYADNRATAQKVYDAQSKWGMVGEFAGKAAAIPTDPLYAVSFFTGYGAAATALQAAGRVAVMEMAIEAVAQPFVYDWKQEIGSDYSGAEALFNVIAAGTLGGAMAGAGKAIELRVRNRDAMKMLKDSGLMDNDSIAPIAHVIRNSDPAEGALATMKRDEALDVATNNRGPSDVIDHGADDAFDKRMDVLEANRKEAKVADEGVAQVTPTAREMLDDVDARNEVIKKDMRSDADDIKASEDAHVATMERTLKTDKNLRDFEKAELQSRIDQVKKRNTKAQADRMAAAEKGDIDVAGIGHLLTRLDRFSQDIENVAAGRPISKIELSPEDLKWLRESPATRDIMKTLDDIKRDLKLMELGTYVPRTKEELQAGAERAMASIRELGKLSGGLPKQVDESLTRIGKARDEGVAQVTPIKPPEEHSIPIIKERLDFADKADVFLDACAGGE